MVLDLIFLVSVVVVFEAEVVFERELVRDSILVRIKGFELIESLRLVCAFCRVDDDDTRLGTLFVVVVALALHIDSFSAS